jgi:hypothetical protein
MAIQTDYPRASLRRSLALAEAIDKLGGESSDESAADGIGNKVGGAFRSLVGAGVKFGLITNSKGRLKTAPLFQDYKLAYSEQQKQDALRRAFLTPPLYAALTKRLEGQQIPSHFEKLLIREYDVPEDYAQRLMGHFTEGAKDAGLLNAQGIITSGNVIITPGTGSSQIGGSTLSGTGAVEPDSDVSVSFVRGYSVRITGPGIDSRIAIKDEDDVEIVEAMLKKVRRLLKAELEGKSGG